MGLENPRWNPRGLKLGEKVPYEAFMGPAGDMWTPVG